MTQECDELVATLLNIKKRKKIILWKKILGLIDTVGFFKKIICNQSNEILQDHPVL